MNKRIVTGTFILVLIIKLLSVLYLTHIAKCENPVSAIGFCSISAGDTYSYIQPAENLLLTGTYFTENELGEKVFAGRMPYYGFFYLTFRIFLEPVSAQDALVFLHIIFESLALIAICLLVFYHTKSHIAYYLSLVLLIFSLNVTYWTSFIMPESLGASFLVLFLYNYYLFSGDNKNRHLIYSSIFLAFLVVLKPYYIFIYALLVFDWLRSSGPKWSVKIKTTILNSVFAGGILVVLLSPWIIRNYSVYQKFVPTQISLYAGINYSKAELAWRDYVTSWGGSIIHWDNNSAGCYFKNAQGIQCEFVLPAKAIPFGFTARDIELIRDEFKELQLEYDELKDIEVENKFLALRNAIKLHDPMEYYLYSKLSLTKEFLFHSGSYYLPASSTSECYNYYFQLIVKLVQSALYYLTLIFGIVGLIFFSFKERFIKFLFFIVLMLILIFPILLKGTEWRYFVYSYYLLSFGSILIIHVMVHRIALFDQAYRRMKGLMLKK